MKTNKNGVIELRKEKSLEEIYRDIERNEQFHWNMGGYILYGVAAILIVAFVVLLVRFNPFSWTIVCVAIGLPALGYIVERLISLIESMMRRN